MATKRNRRTNHRKKDRETFDIHLMKAEGNSGRNVVITTAMMKTIFRIYI